MSNKNSSNSAVKPKATDFRTLTRADYKLVSQHLRTYGVSLWMFDSRYMILQAKLVLLLNIGGRTADQKKSR